MPLKILYEDEHLAAVHKPAGILVSGNKFKTVANALPKNLKPSGIADSCTPHPVHRLDYATTGILLIGKTKSSIRILNKMFEEKKLKKIYMAITIGEMNPYGEISSELDGKAACSEYRVKGSVFSKRFGSLNLVELSFGFMLAPHIGPITKASKATTPPMAMAAIVPTSLEPVETFIITIMRKYVRINSIIND